MKKKRPQIGIGTALAVSFLFLFFIPFPKTSDELPCVKIPFHFFLFLNHPILKIQIEGKTFNLLIDTGFSYPISLKRRCLDQIVNKKPLGNVDFANFRGEVFGGESYSIPDVHIVNRLEISNVCAKEESIEYARNGTYIWPQNTLWRGLHNELSFRSIDGAIGWPIILKWNCLFDFSRSTFYLAPDFNNFKKLGKYSLEKFIQVPFILEKCGLIFTLDTDLGPKRFLLDTGSNNSILHKSSVPEEQTQEPRPDCWYSFDKKISYSGHQLDQLDFALADLAEDFDVDGVLGTDFLKHHIICLDIEHRTAYISPAKTSLLNNFFCWVRSIFR